MTTLATHDHPVRTERWREYNPSLDYCEHIAHDQPGRFGIDRCNDPIDTIRDGLRWRTDTATLIAARDSTDFGQYLFRTPGGRFFQVRHNYPLRGDSSHPIDVLYRSQAEAEWADIAAAGYGRYLPYAEAFGDEAVDA